MTKIFTVAKDFSRSPIGRHRTDGPNSGQRFREDFLYPALLSDDVEVILDGVLTLGSSFLDEAFAGLVRENGMSPKDLRKKLVITCRIKTYVDKTWAYIDAPLSKS